LAAQVRLMALLLPRGTAHIFWQTITQNTGQAGKCEASCGSNKGLQVICWDLSRSALELYKHLLMAPRMSGWKDRR